MVETIKVNDFIEFSLQQCKDDLSKSLDGEVLFLKSPIYTGLDDAIRVEIEKLSRTKKKELNRRLIVVLETNGGYIEVVERICNVFRKYFKIVDFIVPNCAYSAGTVLVLSGDSIYMDYYSILGPIDPQVQNQDGQFIPGMGYLYKYNEIIEKSKNGTITDAELLFLTKRFDPAEMFVIEQAKNHSKDLIKEWLVKYKFKNWKKTDKRKLKVTKKMKEDRAAKVADVLGDAARWHSHGRGITLRDLQSDEINILIDDYGADVDLSRKIRQYYDLFTDYCHKRQARSALHSENGLRRLG